MRVSRQHHHSNFSSLRHCVSVRLLHLVSNLELVLYLSVILGYRSEVLVVVDNNYKTELLSKSERATTSTCNTSCFIVHSQSRCTAIKFNSTW
ncbi:hypothetical protein EB796_009210 [Bugula neritina]|uniref:Uncharacterized protein n=1 Tax=Bugula neritina TaxID=10212 RepID=A0A7J7K1H0_BUGNE|nr:hypothetical protein EB796_009210 [Bugula neritina]